MRAFKKDEKLYVNIYKVEEIDAGNGKVKFAFYEVDTGRVGAAPLSGFDMDPADMIWSN